MFYVKPINIKRPSFIALHLIPTLIIFAAFSGLTLWSWQTARVRYREERAATQAQNIADTQNAIDARIKTYEEILRAGSSVFAASDSVTRNEWDKFADIFDLHNRYPGIQGVGFAKVVNPDEHDAFLAAVRGGDMPNFAITPDNPSQTQVSFLYFAPSPDPYSQSIGYDVYSDPARHKAMDEARDTANSALTGRVTLLTDKGSAISNPSFIMYFPVYASLPPPDVASRRAQISGFVFAPFRSYVLFDSLDTTKQSSAYGYRLYAGEPKDENLLYTSHAFDTISKQKDGDNLQSTTMQFGQTSWTLQFNSGKNLGSDVLRNRPTAILWAGFIFSLLAASLLYALLTARSRALAFADEAEIQEAKDELLALASHQLRTPATGVKQYIGMLREGFVGELSKQQLDLLERAYESNERQLMTINEMLSVARADSGRLLLEKIRINLSKLLEDIIAEQRKAIEKQSQTITLVLPKKPVYAEVDQQYFRMVMENLLNNANKYTPPGGSINIHLKRAQTAITIRVEDTGVGIDDHDYPMLFKKFSRIPNELTNKVSGSGIGLYLARSIIEGHGGDITFTSKVGVGTTFIISLPLPVPKAETTSKSK
jgi:signal transduction histidine kinase